MIFLYVSKWLPQCLVTLCHRTKIFHAVQFSRSVVFDSLWPHRLQHAVCPSPSPGVYSDSCPLRVVIIFPTMYVGIYVCDCYWFLKFKRFPALSLPHKFYCVWCPILKLLFCVSLNYLLWIKVILLLLSFNPPASFIWASLMSQMVKNLPAIWETWVLSVGWEDPLEKGPATRSSILAWRIPRTVKSMGSQRVRHGWVTFTFTSFIHGWFTIFTI